eukprot:2651605-Alexandrium_andersonii.AAC.1
MAVEPRLVEVFRWPSKAADVVVRMLGKQAIQEHSRETEYARLVQQAGSWVRQGWHGAEPV